MARHRFIGAALSIAICGSANADTLGVLVNHSGDDLIGRRLAAEIKNEVRSSPVFHLVYVADQSVYKISIVTIDPDKDEYDSESMTVYSSTSLIDNDEGFDFYLNSHVGTCGANVVKSCAEKLVQELSVSHEEIVEALVTYGAFDE